VMECDWFDIQWGYQLGSFLEGDSNQNASAPHNVHGVAPTIKTVWFAALHTLSVGSCGRSLTVFQPIRIQDACSGVCYVGGTYPSPGCMKVIPAGLIRFSWHRGAEL